MIAFAGKELAEPAAFVMPQVAVHTGERQVYHTVPDEVRRSATTPGA